MWEHVTFYDVAVRRLRDKRQSKGLYCPLHLILLASTILCWTWHSLTLSHHSHLWLLHGVAMWIDYCTASCTPTRILLASHTQAAYHLPTTQSSWVSLPLALLTKIGPQVVFYLKEMGTWSHFGQEIENVLCHAVSLYSCRSSSKHCVGYWFLWSLPGHGPRLQYEV